MLEFKVIELSDKAWVEPILKASDFRGCEYCFANNMAWRRMYNTQIARYKNFYLSCSFSDGIYFTFPAGTGDYKDIFTQMQRFAEENNSRTVIGSVTPDKFHIFDEIYGKDGYTISADEGSWDYVYNSSDLAELAGRKYHGKRNHLKKLLEREHTYEPLTEKDFDECIAYAARNYNDNGDYDDFSKVCEQYAINTYFTHFHELGLQGGVLKADGRVIAFTIGERINSDTLGVHIEKADASFDGAYPAINNYFAKDAGKDFTYINREEDLGIEGLRKAKRSYKPAFMIEKHVVTLKN